MTPRVEDYINRPRDTKREQLLGRELRQLPESTRFEFIQSVLASKNTALGLELAKSVLKEKEYFEQLLFDGLDHGDASSIRLWLKCVVPKLGARRVIWLLKNEAHNRPGQVFLTLYWLPGLIDNSPRTQRAFRELIDLTRS